MDNPTKFPPLHILPPKKPLTEPPENPEFSFNQFAHNGNSAVMREKMLKDTFVLDNIAILGQATAIYAKPNTGKTLIVLWMLIESIKAKRIKGENVFYINADDTYKGLVTKLEITEQYGFKANGSTQKFVAQRYKTTEANLHNWLKKNHLMTAQQSNRT